MLCRLSRWVVTGKDFALGNAAHDDVHDASQGFSVWMEDIPGTATNWYFLMPNVHGVNNDGTHYNGIAIKLRHGTAISWDGRVVRHCTAVPCPGVSNHVYGTFTAAKERIVWCGLCVGSEIKLVGWCLCCFCRRPGF